MGMGVVDGGNFCPEPSWSAGGGFGLRRWEGKNVALLSGQKRRGARGGKARSREENVNVVQIGGRAA